MPGRGNLDRWRPGGLRSLAAAIYEGCIVQHGAEGPAPSRGSASNAHPGRGNVDRWRLGGLRSLAAAIYEGCIVQHGAERPAPSLGIGQQWSPFELVAG